ILLNGEIPDDIKTNLGYLISISDYYKSTSSINKTITQIKSEKKKGKSNIYNVSETALNDFGYELINSQKVNEAVQIFILNTKLYPQGYNTFDSLGECLLLLNRKKEAIKSYQKSLELNPNNENAKKIINEIK
ncbi:MAG: tetratricopeptide repeat protein, partial [Flavobacterium sp.]